MIHVDCEVKDCAAEFFLNDLPINFLDSNQQLFSSKVAHTFLIPGINRLKVVIFPNETPSISQIPYEAEIPMKEGAFALIRVAEYQVNSTPGELDGANVFGELTASLEQFTDQETKPFIAQIDFTLPNSPFPAWHWVMGEPINLSMERNNILAFVKRIHQFFSSGNGAAVADLAQLQIEDAGKAIPSRGIDGLRRDLVQSIDEVKINNEETFPLDETMLDFRVCGGGKLVQLINKDWKAMIRTEEDETGYSYPYFCFVGKVDGKLRILLSL
jgi:hypothetical protein